MHRYSRGPKKPSQMRREYYAGVGDVSGIMSPGQTLTAGQDFYSTDRRIKLSMQTDGNLVLYSPSSALWSSGTNSGAMVSMQPDGNLVVYNSGGQAVWSSGTSGHPGAYLGLQADGNMVIYAGTTAVWASGTGIPPGSAPFAGTTAPALPPGVPSDFVPPTGGSFFENLPKWALPVGISAAVLALGATVYVLKRKKR